MLELKEVLKQLLEGNEKPFRELPDEALRQADLTRDDIGTVVAEVLSSGKLSSASLEKLLIIGDSWEPKEPSEVFLSSCSADILRTISAKDCSSPLRRHLMKLVRDADERVVIWLEEAAVVLEDKAAELASELLARKKIGISLEKLSSLLENTAKSVVDILKSRHLHDINMNIRHFVDSNIDEIGRTLLEAMPKGVTFMKNEIITSPEVDIYSFLVACIADVEFEFTNNNLRAYDDLTGEEFHIYSVIDEEIRADAVKIYLDEFMKAYSSAREEIDR